MTGRVLRVGELVWYRLSDRCAWIACTVEAILLRDRGGHRALEQVDEIDLDKVPEGLLVWFQYRDRMGRSTVQVLTETTRGSVVAHEVRVPGDGMIETNVWSGGRLWTASLQDGGKVRIDPPINGQILWGELRPSGRVKLMTEIKGELPPDLAEDVAWALDFKLGGPRWRRQAHIPMIVDDPAPDLQKRLEEGLKDLPSVPVVLAAPETREIGPCKDVVRDTLHDLLGRLGLTARAAKLKDASAEELRAELLRVLKGETLARMLEERADLLQRLRSEDLGVLTADEDDLAAGVARLIVGRDKAQRDGEARYQQLTDERVAIAKALGVTLREGEHPRSQLLEGIKALKMRPAGGSHKAASEQDVQAAVRDRLMQMAKRLGVDAETLGVNSASAEEIEDAIEAHADQGGQVRALLEVLGRHGVDAGVRASLPLEALQAEVDALVPQLLPELEIACPHCQGGMLITPDLLKMVPDEVPT